jgi:cellulose synthase/poly-beta-1,6-N-acetylglucosamine synthase-like glycosyltransferase
VIWNVLAALFVLLVLPSILELTFLTMGAVFVNFKKKTSPINLMDAYSKMAVIIPAYNEEYGIQRTINSLKSCPGIFEIIVVADNCTDLTVSKAKECHARVLERCDPKNRGKNHALHFAFDILLKEDFQQFLIIDADTVVSSNLIDEIQSKFAKGAEAVQVFYGILNAEQSFRLRLMKVSYLAINLIRPLGRQFWGFSAGIFGNGIAFNRSILEAVPFKLDSIVEDLLYHVVLVKAGKTVKFTANASVLAEMPLTNKAMTEQRVRWEGGRLKTAFNEIPSLLKSIFCGNWRLIEPCLDLLTFPLSYLVLILLLLTFLPVFFANIFGFVGLAIIFFHVIAGMVLGHCGGKDYYALAITPFYLLWKCLLTVKLVKVIWKGSPWNRTRRQGE